MPTPPPTPLAHTPTFGFGDRLGLATPGHLAALQQIGGSIHGIFAQQSIREMARTDRTPAQVMQAAIDALTEASFDQPWGADADHLKTPADVDATLDAGFTFFTIDPSDHVDQQADTYSPAELQTRYDPPPWTDRYLGQTFRIDDQLSLDFDQLTIQRAAVKYGRAIAHAIELAAYIRRTADDAGRPCEIEISVDETDQPTTLHEHFIIADQLIAAGVPLVSLAPRFVGELEKGIDYKGDLDALAASLRDHAAIARNLGPYKLSLHSGSDKLSMYRPLATATAGLLHVKTAGTSYLEAVRVAAREDPDLFRDIIRFSRTRYDTDRATYHVSARLADAPDPNDIADDHQLEAVYLEHWASVPEGHGFTAPARQVLHCTFGSVLTHPTLAPRLTRCLHAHPDTHRDLLQDHFARHLQALQPPQ
jgi:hypothetical protein